MLNFVWDLSRSVGSVLKAHSGLKNKGVEKLEDNVG